MILELKSRQGAYLACQAIAAVQVTNRAIGRSVLEGMVREQLELHLYRALEAPLSCGECHQTMDCLLLASRTQVEEGLRADLESRGVPLTSLQLRPVLAGGAELDWVGRPHLWVEYLSSAIPTLDGFQVVLDIAALVTPIQDDGRVDPLEATRAARGALEEAVTCGCEELGLEDFLYRRAQWTDKILDWAGQAVEQSGLELRALAITDVQVKPRTEAFRPAARPPLDPLANLVNLHFLAYQELVRDAYRKNVDP